MSTPVTLIAGNLPANYCFTTAQQLFEDMVAAMSAELPGSASAFVFGSETPAVEDQDKPWIKTDALGRFERLYTFSGQWLSPHPTPASGDERRIYVGTNDAAGLWSYDGGDGTDPAGATETTGGMWMVDTSFDFKFPLGVGTNPTAYDGAQTSVAVGDTGGEEKHTLTVGEMPEHDHDVIFHPSGTGAKNGEEIATDCGDQTKSTEVEGGGDPHNNMPPYKAVYFIRRSQRVYYTA